MDNVLILQLSCLGILLGLSAFFSGSEAALFALSKLKIRQLSSLTQKRISRLLESPTELLTTLLIGTTLVNVIASALATFISITLCAKIGINEVIATIVAIFGMTCLILFLGEIVPITLGATKSIHIAPWVTYPVRFFYILLAPLRIVLHWITNLIVLLIEKNRFFVKDKELTEEEIRTMVDIGAKEGVLKDHEMELIHSIFEFGDMKVEEVMIPQKEMVGIKIDEDSETKILHLITKEGHSRMPVYKGENIIGIIHVKDFLISLKNQSNWRELIRPPHFVLPSKKINNLLKEFQKKHIQMAIVKNELGKVVGIVTMEDLLEEIVGEIHDEYPGKKRF
ncbi:MAG: hemolysin family protein [bacterium]